MLQKMLGVVKTKAFLFNAMTILVCTLTTIIIPKLAVHIHPRADDGTAITAPINNETPTVTDKNINDPKELGSVKGDPANGLELCAKYLESRVDGSKFWELSVWDTGTGTQIKSWLDIYTEWTADASMLDLGGNTFTVTAGGLKCTNEGSYSVTIRYNELSVLLTKSGSVWG